MAAISRATLERLPTYYRMLDKLYQRGETLVSSERLGQYCGVLATQVRKDLIYFKDKGIRSQGYSVATLRSLLAAFLGLEQIQEVALVGYGNIGSALLGFSGMEAAGTKIVLVFDSNPEKIGQEVLPGVFVEHTDHIASRMQETGVSIGIVAVPANAAQGVAEKLAEGGASAIWNFAPVLLKLPDDVFVRQEDLTVGIILVAHHSTMGTNSTPLCDINEQNELK